MNEDKDSSGFEPPPYPYDRLKDIQQIAASHVGGAVNLSVGAPCDPPPSSVIEALATSGSERSYPASIGTVEFREAAAAWLSRLVGSEAKSPLLVADDVRATIGSKEFVAGLPHWLHLRRPSKDTVLYPAISYPSYAMGATLAGCRAVPVEVDSNWRIDLSTVSPEDAERALCLWVNTPSNPTGALDDLAQVAEWGRKHDVLVVSDECYIEFTWNGSPRSILTSTETTVDRFAGLLAVHSLSKRSNFAGARAGFYAGDADWIHYLSEVRKHAGFMPPGPTQAAAVAAFNDTDGVIQQRSRYHARLTDVQKMLVELGAKVELPEGGFYLWAEAPDGDAWAFAHRLAVEAGVVVSPGEFYGPAGVSHIRVAVVQPEDRLELAASRLGLG